MIAERRSILRIEACEMHAVESCPDPRARADPQITIRCLSNRAVRGLCGKPFVGFATHTGGVFGERDLFRSFGCK